MLNLSDLIEARFTDKLDALAAIVEACSCNVRKGNVIPVLKRPWDWDIPQYAIDVVGEIFREAMAHWNEWVGQIDDPETAAACAAADTLERYERGAPAGDWTFFKWLTASPVDWDAKYDYT